MMLTTMAGGKIVFCPCCCCHCRYYRQLQGHDTHVAVGQEGCGRHAAAFGGAEERRRATCWCWRGMDPTINIIL